MAGLSVLLETHNKNHPGKPRIVSKATLHSHGAKLQPATAASSFLQRCSLCHKELAADRDIYMYRGDTAFCSVECRRRQMFMDEDAGGVSSCAKGASAVRGSRPTGGGGFFAY
ncbi:hypothetical protein EJB05_21008 [Eragrostis curvula]|uniref:FLZ-type domain-containing protein n=1 Tax=Eragrostis curvula TaxID=38414 RepID=A0A5J9UZT4_9POAL|nr:hypothetical protein EJB05_21007 [Eragrostis curvula]TVU29443.1 hypothetical protein EJB05_21008 [Eragrostis curvula]